MKSAYQSIEIHDLWRPFQSKKHSQSFRLDWVPIMLYHKIYTQKVGAVVGLLGGVIDKVRVRSSRIVVIVTKKAYPRSVCMQKGSVSHTMYFFCLCKVFINPSL